MSDCTSLYLHVWEPLYVLYKLLVCGVACGAISMVLTKSTVLNFLHDWVEKRSAHFGKMLNCPWCTSHWVALFLTLLYRPLLLDWTNRPAWMYTSWVNLLLTPVDYAVTIFVMTVIAAITARIIYSTYKPIME